MMPGLTLIFCLCLAPDPLSTAMAMLCMALPTAATSYVIARVMVGDAPLMAAMTSTKHFFSARPTGVTAAAEARDRTRLITGLG